MTIQDDEGVRFTGFFAAIIASSVIKEIDFGRGAVLK
jgi:hypothetical protein